MDGRLLGGRYRLLESYAMGGMASVWRATDEESGEIVAVKRLHPHLVANPDARARFLREASALESVRHSNVVGIRDALDGDEPALVMDFVDGRSLAELAAEGHRFTRSEGLAIAAGVADGLAAVHARGIVHRDVKPANILIGPDGLARLSDFGIAVGSDDDTALTAADGVIGTLRYLAPERLAGEPATPATDVWGVGVVLFELLTGKAAFPASTPTERVELASRPIDRPKGLAEGTWAVLSTCLASDPDDRYEDGAALAAALHALPGVPAAVALVGDPFAATDVIAAPAQAVAPSLPEPASDMPATRLPPSAARTWLSPPAGWPAAAAAWLAAADGRLAAAGAWVRSQPRWLGAAAGVLAFAVMVGAGLPKLTDGDGRAASAASPEASAASPEATAAPPTPAPTLEPTPGKNVDNKKQGKNEEDKKGKGRGGNGGD